MAKIISVTGSASGAGKSTLALGLAKELKAAVIQLDKYETFTSLPPHVAQEWLRRGALADEFPAPGYAEAIAQAHTSNATYAIVDGHLGRTHRSTAPMVDFMIYLDVPMDIALARCLRRQLRNLNTPPTAKLGMLEGHIDSYLAWVRGAYALQHARLPPLADLILDANQPVETLLRQALAAIALRFNDT